ncbi:unnamed protein product, partial [Meganyctiphanes norvegica]
MPSLFACLGCGGKGETDDIKVLDYKHAGLNDVPGDVFASERTLEELYLDSNQLKELPRQLFYCHGLRVLGLSDNEVSAVPPAVASLINLHTLDLSKNSISDIPDNIKGCKQLSVVDASINPLCRLPEGFTQLLHLSELYLNDTFLEYLPANFGRLSRLRILELRENQLNTLPKSMARLTQLQRLDIGQNDFSELPEVIGSLVNLTELWFDNNKVKCIPPMIGKLTKLQHLDATKNKVDGVSAEIHNCTLLTDLNLSSNNLKQLPEALGGCKNLQVLRLDDNAITHLPESLGSLSALEELVLTQNDIEILPSSVGLLRILHTLHLDDNLLAELPSELGSCSRLSVLTASSNQLTCVPAELGHLQRLAVLNLCNNLINNLPVSFSKLKLRALWLSDNQNKPTVNLQSETDLETGQRVLTCFMLPQHAQQNNTEYAPSSDNIPADWEEQRRRKSLIKFATDGEPDKPGNLRRAPTPYPKELKALAKHARNVYALGRDKPPESNNKNNNSSVSSQLIKNDATDAKNLNTVEEPPSKLVQGTEAVVKHLEATKSAVTETSFSTKSPTVPEERPLIHDTPTLQSPNYGVYLCVASCNAIRADSVVTITTIHQKFMPRVHFGGESAYTIGDRKMFGQAQVVATGKTATTTSTAALPVTPNPPTDLPISTSTSNNGSVESNVESIAARIKKPPPYHIAATFSRHAGDFETSSGANVEVNNEINKQQMHKELSNDMGPPPPPVTGPPEDECNDTSSSSDSGYVNSRAGTNAASSRPYQVDGSTLASNPSSPCNTLPPSPTKSFPDHFLSSVSSAGPASPDKSYSGSIGMPESPTKGPFYSGSIGMPESPTKGPSSPMKGLSSFINLGPPSPVKTYNNTDVVPGAASPVKSYPTPSSPSSAGRPASIATTAMTSSGFNSSNVGQLPQRPGSLALGALAADSALLNARYNQGRPGSLAAPCNTLGIPPAPPPARATSHMGINIQNEGRLMRDQPQAPHFRSQNLSSPQKAPGHWAPHQSVIQQTMCCGLLQYSVSQKLVLLADDTTTGDSTWQIFRLIFIGQRNKNKPLSIFILDNFRKVDIIKLFVLSKSLQLSFGFAKFPDFTRLDVRGMSNGGGDSMDFMTGGGETMAPMPPEEPLPMAGGLVSIIDQPAITLTGGLICQLKIFCRPEVASVLLDEAESPRGKPVSQNSPSSPYSPPDSLSPYSGDGHSTRAPTTRIPQPSPSPPHTSVTQDHPHSLQPHIPTPNTHTGKNEFAPKLPPRNETSHIYSGSSINGEAKPESRIPTMAMTRSPSNLSNAPQNETRIPTLSSVGRSPSNLDKNDNETDSRIPTMDAIVKSPASVYNNTGETRIPSLASMGKSLSNLSHKTITGKERCGNSSIPALTRKDGPTASLSNVGSGIPTVGNGGTNIPSLASSGRSRSIPAPAIPTSGLPSYGVNRSTREGSSNSGITGSGLPRAMNDRSSVAPASRILSPVGTYGSGIRLPPPASSMQTPGAYSSSGITSPLSRTPQPSYNARIPTPGVGITSPLSSGSTPTSRLPGPRALRPPTPTTALTKIVTGGGGPSKIGAPSPSPPLLPPGQVSPPSSSSPAWMFGQHKNARVVCDNFPVVIEKNPGLGFTIGQLHGHQDGKNIYVSSVAEGGPASSALKPGDKILQIDGREVRSVDLHTATSILNANSGTISLMVSRLA